MTPSGIEPATFRFVAQHLNHCATAVLRKKSVSVSLCSPQILSVIECGSPRRETGDKPRQSWHGLNHCYVTWLINIMFRFLWGGGLKLNQRTVMNSAIKMKGRTDRQRRFYLVSTHINTYYNAAYLLCRLTLILRRSRTGTVWFYTCTSNKRAARPKLYTKSLTRDLKRMYSRLTKLN